MAPGDPSFHSASWQVPFTPAPMSQPMSQPTTPPGDPAGSRMPTTPPGDPASEMASGDEPVFVPVVAFGGEPDIVPPCHEHVFDDDMQEDEMQEDEMPQMDGTDASLSSLLPLAEAPQMDATETPQMDGTETPPSYLCECCQWPLDFCECPDDPWQCPEACQHHQSHRDDMRRLP